MELDRNLNFNEYVPLLCKKTGKTLSVLARLSNLMSIKQRRALMKSFFESQFGFYSLIWMFHGRGVNNGINNLHEHLLRKVYKDSNSSFKDLLKNDNSFTVHHKNFQSLAIELLKVKQNLSNKIMIDISQTRELTHNLRSQTYFVGSFRS